jgi:hypothetical protein
VETIELSKLPGGFSDVKQDEQAVKNAKQEGLS